MSVYIVVWFERNEYQVAEGFAGAAGYERASRYAGSLDPAGTPRVAQVCEIDPRYAPHGPRCGHDACAGHFVNTGQIVCLERARLDHQKDSRDMFNPDLYATQRTD